MSINTLAFFSFVYALLDQQLEDCIKGYLHETPIQIYAVQQK